MENTNVKKKSGLAIAGLVLGIIGIIFSFIPIINNIAFFLGALSIIFGIIPLITKKSIAMSITALILGILSIIITINVQSATVKVIDEVLSDFSEEVDTITGGNTDDVIENYVDIKIGNFTVDTTGFLDETSLKVTVKNKADEKKSFSIQIEAVDKDGKRIDSDYVYANDLRAGQSQDFKIFELIESDKINDFKNATFNVVEASMY